MSDPAWAAVIHQAQLQMAASAASSPCTVSSSSSLSSSSVQTGVRFVAAASAHAASKLDLAGSQAKSSACRRILSSSAFPPVPPRDSSKATSSETTPTPKLAEECSRAEARPFYGHILTQTLLQNSKVHQLSADGMTGSSCGVKSRQAGQGSTGAARLQPTSGTGASFIRIISAQQARMVGSEEKVAASASQQPSSLPSSPQRGYDCGQVDFPATDSSLGSSVSSSGCVSPDHFLGQSPSSHSVTSPASVSHLASPDAMEPGAHELDSGYSDTLTDKSASPDKHHHTNSAQTSGTKRKRVRKSRAKPQDPELKVIVKKTRRVRANDRERLRMHSLNDAMDELRKHLPSDGNAGKLTKIDTLRTASNYIKVLQMMLVEMDKGEDVTRWSMDMMTAMNNLYVQPAASPDSTGMTPPSPLGMGFEEGHQLQNCVGAVSSGASGGVMMPAPFPGGFQNQDCGLADSFDPSVNGALPCASGQVPGGLSGGKVSVLGDSTNSYSSLPGNNVMVTGYHGLNGFPTVTAGPYSSQQYAVSGHCTSTQTMFLQSSQCY